MIIRTPIYGNPTKNNVPLSVTESGLVLTVSAGAFTVGGEQYELSDEQVFAATVDPVFDTFIKGYLVHEIATGTQSLLVDEILSDGVSQPYSFEDGSYRLIHRLFETVLPEGAVALGNVRVYHIIQRENA